MILDVYAGIGGWDVALRKLGGRHVVGLELDKTACATRAAVRHQTIRCDVTQFPVDHIGHVDGLVASPPCFPAGTPIVTARGVIPIEQVVVGDLVLTHRNRWKRVSDVMSRFAETARLGNIEATLDHPFFTAAQIRYWDNGARRSKWRLNDPVWTPFHETPGQFLAIPCNPMALPIPDFAKNRSAAWWWMVGRWLGDGWIRESRGTVMICSSHKEAGELHKHLLLSGLSWSLRIQRTTYRHEMYSVEMCKFLKEHFRTGARNKTLPGWIFGLPEMHRDAMLSGYLSADGTEINNGWSATSVSQCLTVAMRLLATQLGFTTSIVRQQRDRKLEIEGRLVVEQPTWSLTIHHDDGRYTRLDGQHRWVKQRKGEMKDKAIKEVYDLTVEDDESFTAYGFVVHNCPTFSVAGKRSGTKERDLLCEFLLGAQLGWQDPWKFHHWNDSRTPLILEPWRFITATTPRFVVFEQVPACLPVWETYAMLLRFRGYSVWTGIVNCADTGLPQTRKRACLIASRDEWVHSPRLTHAKHPRSDALGLFEPILPWQTMANALGWAKETVVISNYGTGGDPKKRGVRTADEPAATVTSKIDRNRVISQSSWVFERPSMTLVGSSRPDIVAAPGYRKAGDGPRQNTAGSVKITIQEALTLQGFKPDYPLQGSKTKQFQGVGLAIPPILAERLLEQVI